MSDRNEAIEQVAKSCFADEWANAIEEAYNDEDRELDTVLPNLSGCEIFDVCPFDKMPAAYLAWARELVETFEKANVNIGNDAGSILDKVTEEDDIETSAHYLYMQSVGHGVGLWSEYDLSDDDINVPFTCGPLEVTDANISDYV